MCRLKSRCITMVLGYLVATYTESRVVRPGPPTRYFIPSCVNLVAGTPFWLEKSSIIAGCLWILRCHMCDDQRVQEWLGLILSQMVSLSQEAWLGSSWVQRSWSAPVARHDMRWPKESTGQKSLSLWEREGCSLVEQIDDVGLFGAQTWV